MKQILRLVLLPCLILLLIPPRVAAQCPGSGMDTLLIEKFEEGVPLDWTTPETSDGGQWQVNAFPIGYFPNPGYGKWLYVNDERTNKVGKAKVESPSVDLSDYEGGAFLEFDLLFQEYADSSVFHLEVWDGENWIKAWEVDQDFSGRLQVDLTPLIHPQIKIRWSFDDEGAWAWGMGIDNVVVYGKGIECGNGVCEVGESPENCPGDCVQREEASAYWVPVGQDLQGQKVNYRDFRGRTVCDDCAEPIELGFTLDFFGTSFQEIFLNSNGNLTFERDFLSYTPESFCLSGPKMIAPFFSDVDIATGGQLQYYKDPDQHYAIFTWSDVGYYGCDFPCALTNTFQAILVDSTVQHIGHYPIPQGANVIFTYGDMSWTTGNSSGGVEGLAGSPATVGLNKGEGTLCNDYGTFDHDSHQYLGNTQDLQCPPNGIHHLDYLTLFLSATNGAFLEPSTHIDIKVKSKEEKNVLLWTIDNIKGSSYFIVQRGADSLSFEDLEWVDPLDATEPGTYTFTDSTPLPEDNYYRIWHLKKNGEERFSSVRHVRMASTPEGTADWGQSEWSIESDPIFYIQKIGPNPFDQELNVQFFSPDDNRLNCKLFNRAGMLVWESSLASQEGENFKTLRVGSLAAGEYVLHMIHPKGKAYKRLIRR
ncbi:MAG: nidogen-like domain-containing protein [Bacteroidota bacterium]